MAEKRADELALQAYLYAGGELNEVDSMAFEQRLAQEQPARDALADAVRMSASLAGTSPCPEPAYRQRVRERLRPTWWKRLLGPRTQRGHPLLWAIVGAAAALLVSFYLPRPEPEVRVIEKLVVQTPAAPDLVADEDDDELQDMAQVWAELHSSEHAVNAVSQENLRRTRAEDRRQARKAALAGSSD